MEGLAFSPGWAEPGWKMFGRAPEPRGLPDISGLSQPCALLFVGSKVGSLRLIGLIALKWDILSIIIEL